VVPEMADLTEGYTEVADNKRLKKAEFFGGIHLPELC